MKIFVIGSGGREHVLVWKIAQSPLVNKIYCAPGNPGISELADNVNIAASDLEGLQRFAKEKKIDLTVVGPEDPLVVGIVDQFTASGLKIFGPTKAAAQLEGSKSFSKNLMKKYSISTAEFETFVLAKNAKNYVKQINKFPVVIKASGLAAGKGVLICENKSDAIIAISSIMENKKFGAAGNEIVIEEFLKGDEVSIFALCDGKNFRLLSTSQDHKKVYDDDKGKNTGGMGAYAPAPIATPEFMQLVEKQIIYPTINAMIKEEKPYKGLLYFGIIVTENGPKVLEYNCRFGDPETEVVLPLLESDLVPLMLATIDGNLKETDLINKPGFALDVVLTSGGYPDDYEKGKLITGLEDIDKDLLVFHAGTKSADNKILTNGGRVLNIVGVDNDLLKAKNKVYENIKKINFDKMHYRKDIAYRALNK